MSRTIVPLRRVEGAPSEMSDEALLAACATGDNSALGALFDRYSARVYRFVASRSGTRQADLDDLVQKTFLEIFKSSSKFARRSAVSTWIFGIANNVVRHHNRSEGRRRRLLSLAHSEQLTEQKTVAGESQAAKRMALSSAISGLPEKLREAFCLVYLQGLPGREAAVIIGCREGTLYKRLHQARHLLRDLLEDQR